MSTEYIKMNKDTPLKDKLIKLLERGPLDTNQMGLRLGNRSGHISALCNRYPEVFEKISTHRPTQGKPSIWKLKDK